MFVICKNSNVYTEGATFFGDSINLDSGSVVGLTPRQRHFSLVTLTMFTLVFRASARGRVTQTLIPPYYE